MILKQLLRQDFSQYVRPHFEKSECEVCGSEIEHLHVHHVTHFQDLLNETLEQLHLEYHEDTDDYTDEQLQLIRELMIGKQMIIKYVTCCEPCHLDLHNGSYRKQNKSITRPKKRGKSITRQGRTVICIETKNVYSNMDVAEKQTEIDSSSIGKCCQGKRSTAGGLHWQYYEDYKRQLRMNTDIKNSQLVA